MPTGPDPQVQITCCCRDSSKSGVTLRGGPCPSVPCLPSAPLLRAVRIGVGTSPVHPPVHSQRDLRPRYVFHCSVRDLVLPSLKPVTGTQGSCRSPSFPHPRRSAYPRRCPAQRGGKAFAAHCVAGALQIPLPHSSCARCLLGSLPPCGPDSGLKETKLNHHSRVLPWGQIVRCGR